MHPFFYFSIIGLVAFFIYPMLNEEAGNVCHALEKRVISVAYYARAGAKTDLMGGAFLGALAASVSNGEVASAVIKSRYPNAPPQVGCTLVYWKIIYKPDLAISLAREAGLR
jgi:hypothetical protein